MSRRASGSAGPPRTEPLHDSEPFREPEPDFAVLRGRPDFYATGDRPGPNDILLLVEVADSSMHFDAAVKRPLYARNGIREYWIADLKQRVLHAHRAPQGDRYGTVTAHFVNAPLALALAPEIVVSLNLMFP